MVGINENLSIQNLQQVFFVAFIFHHFLGNQTKCSQKQNKHIIAILQKNPGGNSSQFKLLRENHNQNKLWRLKKKMHFLLKTLQVVEYK